MPAQFNQIPLNRQLAIPHHFIRQLPPPKYLPTMFAQLLGPEIQTLIAERNFAALKECFKEWAPAEIGELIEELPIADQVVVFRLLPHDLAGRAFEYLSHHNQRHLIQAM